MTRILLAWLLGVLCLGAQAAAPGNQHGAMAQGKRPNLGMAVAFDGQGRLWQALAQDGYVYVRHSSDRGANFSPMVAVNPLPEAIAADGENRPKLAFSKAGQVYVSWTRGLDKPYTGNVRFSRSLDGGRSFSAPLTVNDDLDTFSHRFDAMVVDTKGDIHLVWLDKRDAARAQKLGQAYKGSAVYHAVSRDGGASFNTNRKLADHSCECCRLALDVARDGTPVVVWRQVFGKNVRDHALLRLDGRSAPQRIAVDDWAIDACPHHGPALSLSPRDGMAHVVWFTNGAVRQGLFYARGDAAGQRFSTPLAFGNPEQQAAHPDVLSLGARVHVVWKEFDGQKALAKGMSSSDAGLTWSAVRTLADSGATTDHPRLVADQERAFLAWNTSQDGLRLVEMPD